MHRDDDDEELFKEIYVGLLVPASPCMGFAVTEGGAPRLISVRTCGIFGQVRLGI